MSIQAGNYTSSAHVDISNPLKGAIEGISLFFMSTESLASLLRLLCQVLLLFVRWAPVCWCQGWGNQIIICRSPNSCQNGNNLQLLITDLDLDLNHWARGDALDPNTSPLSSLSQLLCGLLAPSPSLLMHILKSGVQQKSCSSGLGWQHPAFPCSTGQSRIWPEKFVRGKLSFLSLLSLHRTI